MLSVFAINTLDNSIASSKVWIFSDFDPLTDYPIYSSISSFFDELEVTNEIKEYGITRKLAKERKSERFPPIKPKISSRA